jgi:catechol 2,3-dioxygenase-like lactoylglutathione lyase family enzyme
MSSLGPLIFLTRDVPKTCGFFVDVLGLRVVHLSPTFAELRDHLKTSLIMRKTDSEAFCATGFSPLIGFHVLDFQGTLEQVKKHGGRLDGDPVKDEQQGWMVSFRSPDGHMFALMEKSLILQNTEETPVTDDPHPASDEIKRLLQHIKI